MPSIKWIGLTQSLLKQPQTITFPPLCFTVGSWYLGSFLWPFGRQTYLIPLDPNNINLDLSLKSTFDHCSLDQFKCSLANLNLAFQFFIEIKGFFAGRLPNRFADLKQRLVVSTLHFTL